MNVTPKYVIGRIKAVGDENAGYDVEFVCSTAVVDRSDEVIEQDGWDLENFNKNPVFMAAHMHRLSDGRSPVIGSFKEIGVVDGELVGKVAFADTELGREYRTLYRDGHMRAVSVGFMPRAGENRTVGGRKRYHHTAQELYEVSAVAVGCNQDALAKLAAFAPRPGRAGEAEDITKAVVEQLGKILAEFAAGLDERLADIEETICAFTGETVNERTPPAKRENAPAGDGSDDVDGAGEAEPGEVARAADGLLAACADTTR